MSEHYEIVNLERSLKAANSEIKCKGEEWAKIFTELRAENARLHKAPEEARAECNRLCADLQHHKHLLEVRDRALRKVETVFGMNTVWPLLDVLKSCSEAVRHLFGNHDCDCQGHENWSEAELQLTEKYLAELINALTTINEVLKPTEQKDSPQ